MKQRGSVILAIMAAILVLITGCQDFDNDQTGRIVIKITDAPFPIDLIDEANVSITKVELRNDKDTTGNPFITVFEDTVEFNLLDLRNGVTADLLETEIPVGNYNLIRLYVDNASISVRDFNTYSVKVPSGAQTGIKIFIKPSLKVAGGLTSEVLLDFNVDRSFVLKGNANTPAGIKGFNFKPVIRAVNNTTAGIVEGVVMDADSVLLADASVWIEQDTVITTAYTSDEGFYAMAGIPTGMYSLSAVKEGFDTVTFHDIAVIEGNLTIQNFVLETIAE
ncbi:MAG: DUF4382 domain-containing protein [Bacteroidales bacterium]|nr:DUF4382 domain-containing protein [Bacteroidales bacterium]